MKQDKCERSEEELEKVAKDIVQYEIDMIIGTYQRRSDPHDPVLKNMIIESFLIHARNLIDFLYPPATSKPDDILSTDYSDSWREKIPEYLGKERERIHKRLAHISRRRDSLNKGWARSKLVRELELSIQSFIDSLPADRKDWFKIGALTSLNTEKTEIVDSTSSIEGVWGEETSD